MTKEASEKIREHIAAYPVGQKFTVDQVRRELRLPTMQSKHYLFAAMVEKGQIRQQSRVKKGRTRHWIYEKIKEFTADETKRTTHVITDDTICSEEKNAFIFGGNPERVAVELHKRREFV